MIKAVIFDWGGVLIDEPDPGINAYCAKYFNVPKEDFIIARKKFNADFDRGLPESEFWENVCAELKVPTPTVKSLWVDAFNSTYSEKKEVFSIISSLKKNGYKIGFLSNTEIPALDIFNAHGYDMFDALVFSCNEGTIKPEKRIYEIAWERLNVKPEEAVFIDNKEINAEGAKKAGMKGIFFKSVEQLKKELSSLSVKV